MASSAEPSVLYVVPKTETALALAASDTRFPGKKVYRKQLIYCDDFEKKTDKQHIQFSVTKPLLHHWKNTLDKFKSNGVNIPMPLSHIEDEVELVKDENKHGELLDTEIAKDEKGRDSLYGFITSDNEELVKNSDVSIYVPGEYKDTKGNVYYRPIRHVCFTKDPVIKGLEKFQAIAASLSDETSNKDLIDMAKIDAKGIAKLLGVNPDLNESAMETAIEKAISELLDEVKELKDVEPVEEDVPIAAAFIRIAKDSRVTKVDELVNKGIITPAVKAELEKVFIDDKKLSLSLSLSKDGKEVIERDSFTEVIKALSINDPVKLREQTKAQALSLDNSGNAKEDLEKNPLVKNAKERKEAAATR